MELVESLPHIYLYAVQAHAQQSLALNNEAPIAIWVSLAYCMPVATHSGSQGVKNPANEVCTT